MQGEQLLFASTR